MRKNAFIAEVPTDFAVEHMPFQHAWELLRINQLSGTECVKIAILKLVSAKVN